MSWWYILNDKGLPVRVANKEADEWHSPSAKDRRTQRLKEIVQDMSRLSSLDEQKNILLLALKSEADPFLLDDICERLELIEGGISPIREPHRTLFSCVISR